MTEQSFYRCPPIHCTGAELVIRHRATVKFAVEQVWLMEFGVIRIVGSHSEL